MPPPHLLIVFLSLGFLGACRDEAIAEEDPLPEVEMDEVVPHSSLARGHTSAIVEPRLTLARDAEAFAALWAEHAANSIPVPPAPEVDFAASMVVAVFLGQRTSGGYSLDVESCRREDGRVVVVAREGKPAADAMVTMALTAPYELVTMPRSEGEVVLELDGQRQ